MLLHKRFRRVAKTWKMDITKQCDAFLALLMNLMLRIFVLYGAPMPGMHTVMHLERELVVDNNKYEMFTFCSSL